MCELIHDHTERLSHPGLGANIDLVEIKICRGERVVDHPGSQAGKGYLLEGIFVAPSC